MGIQLGLPVKWRLTNPPPPVAAALYYNFPTSQDVVEQVHGDPLPRTGEIQVWSVMGGLHGSVPWMINQVLRNAESSPSRPPGGGRGVHTKSRIQASQQPSVCFNVPPLCPDPPNKRVPVASKDHLPPPTPCVSNPL